MGASVAVVDDLAASDRPPLVQGLFQRIEHEACMRCSFLSSMQTARLILPRCEHRCAAVNRGAHGLGVLGLGTEVSKLTTEKRDIIVDCFASELNGRLPLCVTVAEVAAPDAARSVQYTQDAGAAFIILQPPPQLGALESTQDPRDQVLTTT
jgi:hypothetical protein